MIYTARFLHLLGARFLTMDNTPRAQVTAWDSDQIDLDEHGQWTSTGTARVLEGTAGVDTSTMEKPDRGGIVQLEPRAGAQVFASTDDIIQGFSSIGVTLCWLPYRMPDRNTLGRQWVFVHPTYALLEAARAHWEDLGNQPLKDLISMECDSIGSIWLVRSEHPPLRLRRPTV